MININQLPRKMYIKQIEYKIQQQIFEYDEIDDPGFKIQKVNLGN
jgi:hypothetical protein